MAPFNPAARLSLAVTACLSWSALAQNEADSASASATVPAWPLKTFLSEPSLHPLVVNTSVPGQPSDELLFVATDGPVPAANEGPLIVDENGNEIWISKGHAFNFGPQVYMGEPIITWWNGTIFPEPVGRGYGNILIANSSYQVIANVSLEGNFQATDPSQTFGSYIDLHENFITERDSIVVTANNVTAADLTSVGGPKSGYVVDSQFYEIDVATNEVLYSWKSLDHLDQLPFKDSVYPLGSEGFTGLSQTVAWAYFHINAVSPFEDGYLVSSRYFCSIMAVDRDGNVKWRVQGRDGGDFDLALDAHFCFQHDARHLATVGSDVILSMHDNANSPLTEPKPTTPSSGLVVKLDLNAKTAALVKRYQDPKNPIYSSALGSYQGLPNTNVLVGHGFVPVIEEFAHNGQVVATTQFGPLIDGRTEPIGGTLSYRAFKSAWTGCPTSLPAVATKGEGKEVVVAMSWNGATGIIGWNVFSGKAKHEMRLVKFVPKHSFQTITSIEVASYVQVEAVGGSECGLQAPRKSSVIAVEGPACQAS